MRKRSLFGASLDRRDEDGTSLREYCRRQVARGLQQYRRTGNPIHAWEVVDGCLHAGLPIPPAVQLYLVLCSFRLRDLRMKALGYSLSGMRVSPESIAAAFDMGGKASSNCFTELRRADTDRSVILHLERLVRDGFPMKQAVGLVCGFTGVKERKARALWAARPSRRGARNGR